MKKRPEPKKPSSVKAAEGRRIKPVKRAKPAERAKPAVEINHLWCKGCYICVEFCPQRVFERSNRLNARGFYPVIVARPASCTRCLECEILCPDLAITVQ